MDETELTADEAARLIGVPKRTVHYWLKVGYLRGYNVRDRLWLIPRTEVERVQQEGRPPRGRPRQAAPAHTVFFDPDAS